MTGRRLLAAVALAGLGLGFLFGLYSIFGIRFSSGEQYPSYSTFSPAPQGSKALHEVAARLAELRVERALDPIAFRQRKHGQETVIFALGAEASARALSSSAYWLELENKVRAGAKVVLTFSQPSPLLMSSAYEDSGDESEEQEKQEEEANAGDPEEADERHDQAKEEGDDAGGGVPRGVTLQSWLQEKGVALGFWNKLPAGLEEERLWGELTLDGSVRQIGFKSPQYLVAEDGDWEVLAEAYGRPMALARQIGEGELVIFSDSYPFSNEALAEEHSGFLFAWLLGGAERVVFHEVQLGVTFRESFMSLARKHGFDVALLLLLVTAGVFIWRSSFSLLPREPLDRGSQEFDLSSSITGLRNLLERSVPRKRLAPVSYQRWARSRAARRLSEAKREQAKQILDTYERSAQRGADLDAFCRAMSDLVARRLPGKNERHE